MSEDQSRDASEFMRPSAFASIPRSSHMLLFLLIAANISSLLDRAIMSMLIDPITKAFDISYIQFGILHGAAFALLYSFLGIPVGRAVDQFSRVRIISYGILIWSAMTALCGATWNLTSLFLARMGVGVGEAALNPAAISLLSDSYPRRYLARAIGTFMMSGSLGFGLSFALGGLLVSTFAGTPIVEVPLFGPVASWKLIFVIVALPGFVLAFVMRCVPEPARKSTVIDQAGANGPSFRLLARFLRANAWPLTCHFLGFTGITVLINGLMLWAPTFLQQTYHLTLGKAGAVYGAVFIVAGCLGAPAGGWMSDTIAKKGKLGAPLLVAMFLAVVGFLPAAYFPWCPTLLLCCALLGLITFCFTAQTGLALTALQMITPNELRGQVSALFLLVVNVIGLGVGPVLVPLLSRHIFVTSDLRPSLSVIAGTAFALAFVCLRSGLSAFRGAEKAHMSG